MIDNPAKAVYMKFDLAAKLMAKANTTYINSNKEAKGLLKRLNIKSKDTSSSTNEPMDIAMKYFLAIRKERNLIKSNRN